MTDPKEPGQPTGPQEGRCGAVRERDEKGTPIRWCRKYPMRGSTRCERDGAAAPQVRAAVERRQAEDAARAAVATYGLRRDVDPREALLEELQWTAGHVTWLRQQVQQLAPQDLVWGLTEEKDVGSGEHPGLDITQAAKPSVWWDLYMQERKLLLALLKEAREARIEERRIELAEKHGALVAEVIRASFGAMLTQLADMGLPSELQAAWPQLMAQIVPTQLRALGPAA